MSRTDIDFKIGADLKQFRGAMGNIDHSLRKLSGGFGALGGVIGASFAIDIIQQFAAESIDLASKMEGVEAAFNRLNDPNLLDNLREATAGTVDDLKLMQTAVKADNFRIPMDVLAKGLEFAQRRAQATGESVDYMVDSFVTGLGRESVKILDNLGISSLELQEKTKELGSMAAAVGQIMDQEFEKVGARVTTTSMKIDQQRAAITNLKSEIGEKLLPVYSAFLTQTNKGLGKLNFILDDQEKGYKRLFVAAKSYFDITKFGVDLVTNPLKALLGLFGETEEEVEKVSVEFNKGLPSITAWSDKFGQMQEQADEGAKKQKEAVEAYNNKLKELLPTLQRVSYEIDQAFNPGEDTSGNLAHNLGFAEVNMELEELEQTTEEFGSTSKKTYDEMVEGFFNFEQATEEAADTFDHSFRNMIDKFQTFKDEFLMIGDMLRASFEAAFVPLDQLEEGETRIMRFREVFVQQLRQMAAQLLATAAAAAILATILTIAFGGANAAGTAMFKKSGMGFGDLFSGMFGQMGGGFGFNGGGFGGGEGGMNIIGMLRGSDMLVMLDRAGNNRNRLSGIGG